MSVSNNSILIIGATGQQGRAVISALIAQPESSELRIVAVTRNPSSQSAQALASLPNVRVIAGELSNPESIFEAVGDEKISGVFLVQVNSDAEESCGKAFIDVAVLHGVSHIVYSSGDRGGPVKSDINPTSVKNFAAKYAIERHLKTRAEKTGISYTILRPVTFFENLSGDLHGRGFARMWAQLDTKKLQFVSVKDIGWFASQALLRPDSMEYRDKALTLVGDELTQKEAEVVFRKSTGAEEMPMAPCIIGNLVKTVKRDTVGDMFAWFKSEGYGGSVEECRKVNPGMQDWGLWLDANKRRWSL
ncbi:hypothetical protein BGZ63DRAFT_390302 [Mariannaea sp. PMI_226]|nr:hypothetical protein BGZ63DRAFT_390302 [Mariannaea sp. PMI_226]